MNLIMLDPKLDYFFPFIVFFYGAVLVFMHEFALPLFAEKASTHAGSKFQALARLSVGQLTAHKPLAWGCFWVGGLWSLQNLLL